MTLILQTTICASNSFVVSLSLAYVKASKQIPERHRFIFYGIQQLNLILVLNLGIIMKLKTLFTTLPLTFGIVGSALAAPEDMVVTAFDPGCEYTMTTNHFELAPGESVELNLDLSGCYEPDIGGLMYFGYYTTKNSSDPLVERNNVRLTLIDEKGNELFSDSGSVYTEPENAQVYKLLAKNMNHKKDVTIRLRARTGL